MGLRTPRRLRKHNLGTASELPRKSAPGDRVREPLASSPAATVQARQFGSCPLRLCPCHFRLAFVPLVFFVVKAVGSAVAVPIPTKGTHMTNLTQPASHHPRPSALHSAPKVSTRETRYPWTCPGFRGSCLSFAAAVPLVSHTPKTIQSDPKPQTHSPSTLAAPALRSPSSVRAKQGRPASTLRRPVPSPRRYPPSPTTTPAGIAASLAPTPPRPSRFSPGRLRPDPAPRTAGGGQFPLGRGPSPSCPPHR